MYLISRLGINLLILFLPLNAYDSTQRYIHPMWKKRWTLKSRASNISYCFNILILILICFTSSDFIQFFRCIPFRWLQYLPDQPCKAHLSQNFLILSIVVLGRWKFQCNATYTLEVFTLDSVLEPCTLDRLQYQNGASRCCRDLVVT